MCTSDFNEETQTSRSPCFHIIEEDNYKMYFSELLNKDSLTILVLVFFTFYPAWSKKSCCRQRPSLTWALGFTKCVNLYFSLRCSTRKKQKKTFLIMYNVEATSKAIRLVHWIKSNGQISSLFCYSFTNNPPAPGGHNFSHLVTGDRFLIKDW